MTESPIELPPGWTYGAEIDRQLSRVVHEQTRRRDELAKLGCEECYAPTTVMIIVQHPLSVEEIHMRCDEHREFTSDSPNVTVCSPPGTPPTSPPK